jgi:L-amino acid N-acyltransferase YncA
LPADDAECVVRQTDITIRRTVADDLDDIGRIYAHHVQTGVATFELDAPDQTEWQHRLQSVTDRGLPFLTATLDGRIAGYAYCAPWKTRPAYRHTVEDSIYLAPDAVGRGIGGRLLDALLTECTGAGVREVIAVIVDADGAGFPGAAPQPRIRRCRTAHRGRFQARPVAGHYASSAKSVLTRVSRADR